MAATRARIIVLEDDADISKLLKLNLESAGFEVRSFASAHGLLSAATAEKPVLFLLDIMVPGAAASTSARPSDSLRCCRTFR
jgi:two-component system, NtrC family, response regulator GlrR